MRIAAKEALAAAEATEEAAAAAAAYRVAKAQSRAFAHQAEDAAEIVEANSRKAGAASSRSAAAVRKGLNESGPIGGLAEQFVNAQLAPESEDAGTAIGANVTDTALRAQAAASVAVKAAEAASRAIAGYKEAESRANAAAKAGLAAARVVQAHMDATVNASRAAEDTLLPSMEAAERIVAEVSTTTTTTTSTTAEAESSQATEAASTTVVASIAAAASEAADSATEGGSSRSGSFRSLGQGSSVLAFCIVAAILALL